MTKAQAMAMNKKFVRMDSTIKDYEVAYKYKYAQANQLSRDITAKDSAISVMVNELNKKPMWKPVTKLDVWMAGLFVSYAAAMTLILY